MGHLAALLGLLLGCRFAENAPPPPVEGSSLGVQTDVTSVSQAVVAEALGRLFALPRGLGDPARVASIDHLARELEALGGDVVRLDHTAVDAHDGRAYALTELIAHVRPHAQRRFVLATHFDTRPWADEETDPTRAAQPVPGANDGTSGLTALLVLAPLLVRQLPPDVGFSVALFDGEELGHPGDSNGYCAGSRWLAAEIAGGRIPPWPAAEFGIVLDLVGDQDLHISIEPSSRIAAPDVVELVWSTAADLGVRAFEADERGDAIVDDHRFLSAMGIPSILIIDREYAAWHRVDDDLAHVSPASMAAVAEVVRVALLRRFGTRGGSPATMP